MHRRRQKKWHWGWITLIVAAVQLTALLAVQGGEAAENWQNLFTVREESVEEVSATEEKNEAFLGYPRIYTSTVIEEQEEMEDLRPLYPIEALQSFENLRKMYMYDPEYLVPYPELLDAERFMERELTADFTVDGPQILIFHTHGSETYADGSSVREVGEYLKEVLEQKYGVSVLHDTTLYDTDPQVSAYDKMRTSIQAILDAQPSLQVTIDLHRDGVGGDGRLITQIDGETTAQLMCVTGISAEYNSETGRMEETSYLYNPNREANLAFSFRAKMACDALYPGLMRRIYLSTYRYSTYMREKGMLLEVGAQGNLLDECKRAMDDFAPALMQILNGKG